MLTTYNYKNLVWVDLESPTTDEIKEVMQKYGVHPNIAEELLSPTTLPRLDVYKKYLYLILHFPIITFTGSNENNQEVDFIIGKNFLITVRYDSIETLNQFAQELEMDAILDPSIASKHAGYMFYYMLRKLYRSLANELEYLEGRLEKIEEHIFKGEERQMVEVLSRVNRNLLDIKQTIEHHEQVLRELRVAGKTLFPATFISTFEGIFYEYQRSTRHTANLRDFLRDLRSTNDSLLSTKQNEVMKTLTIMASITFPLSLVASVFGMNTGYLPFAGSRGDFWIVIGMMAILTAVFFWFFKYKKWL
ncbi:magnesium transporter CorA family protein [Candidatus Wolfebacteria bacterium]|nr:magnesium transporter CorA family protein [Candidatus Wolfebacteria bacterium]